MSRELYAVPVLLGCSLFVLVLEFAPEYRLEASIVTVLLSFAIRSAAIRWDLRVPECFVTKSG